MSSKQDNNLVPRITGLLVLEVRKSNPNGDPERESSPRQRPDGKGEISPVSVKRKLRDLVSEKEGIVWSEQSFIKNRKRSLKLRRTGGEQNQRTLLWKGCQ